MCEYLLRAFGIREFEIAIDLLGLFCKTEFDFFFHSFDFFQNVGIIGCDILAKNCFVGLEGSNESRQIGDVWRLSMRSWHFSVSVGVWKLCYCGIYVIAQVVDCHRLRVHGAGQIIDLQPPRIFKIWNGKEKTVSFETC